MTDPLTGLAVAFRASWHRSLTAAGCVNPTRELVAIAAALGPDPVAVGEGVARRAAGMPIAQVCGRVDFCGLELRVGPGDFVPRARSQLLAGVAFDVARRRDARVAVELGCGVGPIAAVLASRCAGLTTLACDISESSLSSARHNGDRYGFEVWRGDWWDSLPAVHRGRVDLAAAYLPHVPDDELGFLSSDSRWEDLRAFQGGPDGLVPFRAVLAGAVGWLAPDGRFLTLVHRDQVGAASALARDAGYVARQVQASHDGHDVVLAVAGR